MGPSILRDDDKVRCRVRPEVVTAVFWLIGRWVATVRTPVASAELTTHNRKRCDRTGLCPRRREVRL